MSKSMMTAVAKWLRKLASWLAPVNGLGAQIEQLLSDPAYQPILRAIRKANSDPDIASADAETKYREALEWAVHYSSKKIARPDAWKTRFLLELIVGLEKGKLTR